MTQTDPKPVFHIGSIPVHGDLILAPMDGICDQPTRALYRAMGSAVTYTEFINVLDVPARLNNLDRRILFSQMERPVGFQLYGSQPQDFVTAAKLLLADKPDFFDINLGCSVQRVAGRGAGAGLLADPPAIAEIFRLLKAEIDLPITAKIRIGFDEEHRNYLEVAELLEKEGAAALAVHGRTRRQKWSQPADWQPIREIKARASIPVIGNGDVVSLTDIQRMFAETGCDALMIGRAALGNPWLFSRVEKSAFSREEIVSVIQHHWQAMADFYGAEKASFTFRKHMKAYLDCPQFAGVDYKPILRSLDPLAELKDALQA
ncbi:MAG: tRNA-dihydrouridine synthase [Chloroflexota bacterium]|nr:tRNA-dihydrouridine synthase [Chloroflexota bacterium]